MLLLHNLCVAAVLVLTCDLCFQGNPNCCWTELLWQKSSWVLRPPENHRARVAAECRWLKWWTVDVTDARGILLVHFSKDLGRQVTYAGSILGLVWNSKKKNWRKERERESNWKNKFCLLNPAAVLESWFFFFCGKGHAGCKSHCFGADFFHYISNLNDSCNCLYKGYTVHACSTKNNNNKRTRNSIRVNTPPPVVHHGKRTPFVVLSRYTGWRERSVWFRHTMTWKSAPFTEALSLLVKSSHSLDPPCMVECNFVS